MGAGTGASTRTELADGTVVVRTPNGEGIYKYDGGVCYSAARGIHELAAAQELTRGFEATLDANEKVLLVSYAPLLEGFSPEAREHWTVWVRKNRLRPARGAVLVRSKVVQMTLSVLAMFGHNTVEFFSNEPDYYSAVDGMLPRGQVNPRLERRFALPR
jgi:hypothetical protein